MHDIGKYVGNDEDEADAIGDNDADKSIDDRKDEGDYMVIDEESADSMIENEDAMGEEHTSDIEMIDAMAIVEHPEESNPESVTENINDDEIQNSYIPAEANCSTCGGDRHYSHENNNIYSNNIGSSHVFIFKVE